MRTPTGTHHSGGVLLIERCVAYGGVEEGGEVCLPHHDDAVVAATAEVVTARREADPANRRRVAVERVQLATLTEVPDLGVRGEG